MHAPSRIMAARFNKQMRNSGIQCQPASAGPWRAPWHSHSSALRPQTFSAITWYKKIFKWVETTGGLQDIIKIAWIGIWRMWQHLSCYIGNGFTSNWHTEKKRKDLSTFHRSHGEALVPKQPMNLDVMARHAQTACTQIYHIVIQSYSHTWMARRSVVLFVTCFWLSNFVASPSRDTIDGLFSRIASKWSTTYHKLRRFVGARDFSRYLSRCWQRARHFHVPRLISWPRPWEPWLLKSGLPWLRRLHIGKYVRKWRDPQIFFNNGTMTLYSALRSARAPNQGWRLRHQCLPAQVKKGPGWEKFG